MPTGLTADIYDDKPGYTVHDYLCRIATHFGWMVQYRDSTDADPRKIQPFVPSNYHLRGLHNAEGKLKQLLRHDDKWWKREYRFHVLFVEEENIARRNKNDGIAFRYDWMIEQVEAWDVGDDEVLQNTKDLALRQLRESKKFDVHDFQVEYAKTWKEHREETINGLKREIENHRRSYDKEVERALENNKVLFTFLANLPPNETMPSHRKFSE